MVIFLRNLKIVYTIVLILDGSSAHDAHFWSTLIYFELLKALHYVYRVVKSDISSELPSNKGTRVYTLSNAFITFKYALHIDNIERGIERTCTFKCL